LGISYKELEEKGIIMTVADMKVRFKGPAKYDELLKVVTTVPAMPGRSMNFETTIYNEEGKLINEGTTHLLFMKADTRKPCSAPAVLIEALQPYFKEAL
jgi:acyl-CoA thioester hydrolase